MDSIKIEVSRNETGNGYAVIIRDIRFQVESLIPIESAYVTPLNMDDNNNLWYEVRGIEGTYYIHNMNMFHVKHITGISQDGKAFVQFTCIEKYFGI
ncbi:hypothetical protein ACT7DZ_18635 [Bacillus cereus]